MGASLRQTSTPCSASQSITDGSASAGSSARDLPAERDAKLRAVLGPLLAVDAPYLLYRAFFALPKSIKGPDGMPVNALLGAVNAMLFEVERHEPRAVVACFGPDAAPYRVELYAGYHAHRPPVPDELAAQWQHAPRLFEALGWLLAEDASVEADDLLGSYARAERAAGGEALLLTGDRDLFQCAGDGVTVLYLGRGGKGADLVDAAEVKRRYGVAPELVPDFIALRGDPSDGLPGAKGVGEKTAAELLHRHGSLEAAIERRMRESPRMATALADPALRDYKEIATLRTLPLEPPPDTPTDSVRGAAVARELGMERLAKRLEGSG
jgi:DNA polymerase-1